MLTVSNGKMYEYKMLRDEVVYIMRLQKRLSFILVTIVPTYISLIIEIFNQPLYILFACLIVYYIYYQSCFYSESLIKISTYMIVNLEPSLPGIQWETQNLFILLKNKKSKIIYFEYIMVYLYVMIAFIYKSILKNYIVDIYYLLALVIATCLLIHIIYKMIVNYSSQKLHKIWIERWLNNNESIENITITSKD